MRVAVVTDAISAGGYFPAWYAYYSGLFGGENVHVLTYVENEEEFKAFSLGSIRVLSEGYDDELRRDAITRHVTTLLDTHDCVVRVDVDEFLVVDPKKFPSLLSYLENWNGSHITAHGFDIIQSPEEPTIDVEKEILGQRRFAYALTAMNKTCVTRVPLKWNRGFHYCTLPPAFNDLYLFHLKRADINFQAEWNAKMRPRVVNDASIARHYSWELEKILQYHRYRLQLPIINGADSIFRAEFNEIFLKKIRFSKYSKIFDGPYDIEGVNIMIPDYFIGLF